MESRKKGTDRGSMKSEERDRRKGRRLKEGRNRGRKEGT